MTRETGVKIEKNIPIPPPRSEPQKFPWRDMEVGDSFFVAHDATRRSHLASRASVMGKRLGWRFTCRTVVEDGVRGVRVWRTE